MRSQWASRNNDTNQVDKELKYPRHDAATQQCNKCYSAKAGADIGACSLLHSVGDWCRTVAGAEAQGRQSQSLTKTNFRSIL
jgi:hypothetical protein